MSKEELKGMLEVMDLSAGDMLLSVLAAAAASYRRSTCTTPFPSALFESGGERDYAALLETLQSLPPVAQLAATADHLSVQQASLLLWLLTHPRRPVSNVRRCTLRECMEQLPSLTGWVAEIGKNPQLRPQAVMQLAPVPPSMGDTRILAFHGTSLENMHSILHNGLLNLSGTRLERTGSAFGKGIYFSSELSVAHSFSQPADRDGWHNSALGARLRCLLVCSIDKEHAQGSHNNDMVPDKYIVVERMDAVEIHFVFVYSDAAPRQGPTSPAAATQAQAHMQRQAHAHGSHAAHAAGHPRHHFSPLWLILAAYVGWLVWAGMQNNWPYIRRMLRRQLGIRI